MDKKNLSLLYTFLAIICWSTAATAIKITLNYQNPLQMVFLTAFSSFLCLTLIITGQKKWVNVLSILRKNFLKCLLLGTLTPFIYYSVLYFAYNLSWAQEAMTLNYTWSIFLTLFSLILLKQKLEKREIVAIFVSFIGVIILTSHGKVSIQTFQHPVGISLALGSALLWATYWILNLFWVKDVLFFLWIQFAIGSFLALLMGAVTKSLFQPILLEGLLGSVYIGLFEMSLPFYFWFLALKSAEKTIKPANWVFLSPLISLIFITFVLKEKIIISSLIGFVFILAGILLQNNESVTKPA